MSVGRIFQMADAYVTRETFDLPSHPRCCARHRDMLLSPMALSDAPRYNHGVGSISSDAFILRQIPLGWEYSTTFWDLDGAAKLGSCILCHMGRK